MRVAGNLALAAALALSAGAAQAQPAVSAFAGLDPLVIEDLVAANRILAHEMVLDGFGHVRPRAA